MDERELRRQEQAEQQAYIRTIIPQIVARFLRESIGGIRSGNVDDATAYKQVLKELIADPASSIVHMCEQVMTDDVLLDLNKYPRLISDNAQLLLITAMRMCRISELELKRLLH